MASAQGTEGLGPAAAGYDDTERSECVVAVPPLPPVRIECVRSSRMETGGSVWEGGEALARWMAQHDGGASGAAAALGVPPLASCSVLELGAGTGLCSVVAAVLGASDVLATDGDPIACAQCAANGRRNGVRLRVQRLLWGERHM